MYIYGDMLIFGGGRPIVTLSLFSSLYKTSDWYSYLMLAALFVGRLLMLLPVLMTYTVSQKTSRPPFIF